MINERIVKIGIIDMGVGYGEKATLWVEGANYCAFTCPSNMAEAVGDRDTHEYEVYIAAKMISLRIAIYVQGRHYLYKFFDTKSWYGHRDIPEEYRPFAAFQFKPTLGADRLIRNGISLLTSDAICPELFEAFRAHIPEINRETMAAFRKGILNGRTLGRYPHPESHMGWLCRTHRARVECRYCQVARRVYEAVQVRDILGCRY